MERLTTTPIYSLESGVVLRQQNAEAIEQSQTAYLKQHLLQAQSTPFYKKRYFPPSFDIRDITSTKDVAELAFTTRSQLDEYPDEFGLQDKRLYRDYALTSGTTGEPVVVPYTENDLKRLAFNEAMAFLGAGVTEDDSVLLTVTLDRCFIAGLAYYSGVTFLGASAIRSGPGQPSRQWQIINRLMPKVMVGVPTFLKMVGVWGKENGIDVANSPVKSLVTIGEPVRKYDNSLTKLGEELADIWGASIYSSYGATEFETAFCECSKLNGGHVHPELMLTEIVDDNGNVLPDGEAGEVVVTPLGVEGFPLIRFKTGDIARLDSTPCQCGWNTKRLGPVEGRLAQRLKYKGTTFYPENIFHALQDIQINYPNVEVYSSEDDTDDVKVVVGIDDSTVSIRNIEEKIQAYLRVKPEIVTKTVDEVQTVMSAGGGRKLKKFFDFRN